MAENSTQMREGHALSFFFAPKSVAVVGASSRPGSWGYRIADGLLARGYESALYLVNPNAQEILGVKVYPKLEQVPGAVELVIIVISADKLWDTLEECARKRVKGIVIISSGFGEALGEEGKQIEEKMAQFCRENGIRLIGPNVSGVYNLHLNFCASGEDPRDMISSNMSFICQGGFAIHNIVISGRSKGIGLGKFIHTGNEADLQCTDFLEFLGEDPETQVILMYIEGIKTPRRFLQIARRITPKKPIIVYKGGSSKAGNRAAASHTGALAGNIDFYRALFRQAGCITAPAFETILELGHAFTFYPPPKGSKVGIVTMGGSWGVMLTDHISRKGFRLPELSASLQGRLRAFGMPYRASTRNPVDFGAAGFTLGKEARLSVIEALLSSPELDALIYHGHGFGGIDLDSLPKWVRERQRDEEELLRKTVEMMRAYDKPFFIGCHMSHLESATIRNLVQDGIPVFSRLQDIADCLSSLYLYYQRKTKESTL
jgi:acyl-CoA synthetase (NDP forming)